MTEKELPGIAKEIKRAVCLVSFENHHVIGNSLNEIRSNRQVDPGIVEVPPGNFRYIY